MPSRSRARHGGARRPPGSLLRGERANGGVRAPRAPAKATALGARGRIGDLDMELGATSNRLA
uniref:Uncharacterized protein n=1 Tax=Oryza punctata TaxID=4537 RepID=A0A0E0KFU1_ORYPU